MVSRRMLSINGTILCKAKSDVVLESICVLTPDADNQWTIVVNISEPNGENFWEKAGSLVATVDHEARSQAIGWLKQQVTHYLQQFNHPSDFTLDLDHWKQESVG